MHETIGKMSSRISQLQEAIGTLQSLVSTQPHPLLHDRDEQNTHPIVSTQPKKPPPTIEEEFLEAFGAFSIGEKGETTFHEASAISEASFKLFHSTASDPLLSLTVSPDSSFNLWTINS
jgi:hypothetical protein